MALVKPGEVDIDQPLFDQSTYEGRVRHFIRLTNPLNLLATDADLDNAKRVIDLYKQGELESVSEEELWRCKYLYDSAYRKDGEKMFLLGRISAQVPMNTTVIGAMLALYRSIPGSLFMQWFNQSFNALVNYTNRSDGNIDNTQIATAYVIAVSGCMGASMTLNRMTRTAPRVISKMVPFMVAIIANCINIPVMRSHELRKGIPISNEKDRVVGQSQVAAAVAISQVSFSRTLMASPSMIFPPIILSILEKRWSRLRRPVATILIQAVMTGIFVAFATPMCCALFPQRSSIKVAHVEPELHQNLLHNGYQDEDRLFFNKGL